MELSFNDARPSLEEIRKEFEKAGLNNVTVQSTGEKGIIARFGFLSEDEHQTVLGALRAKFQTEKNELREESFQTIGAAVSKQLRERALWAIILVSLGIVSYIAYAFRKVSYPVASWKYGVLAIVSLIHDLLLVIAVFAVLGRFFGMEVDIAFVVALLTVLGY